MAKLLKLRRGTTTQHGSFTGAEGEVTVDTDKETLVVHDGSTAGGHPVAAEDMANVSSASIAGRLANDSIAPSKIAGGTLPSDVTVASANLVDGTIVAGDLASNAITTVKITDSNVTTAKIADNAVTMAKLNSGTLPTDIAVSSSNLVDGTIVNADIASNANIAGTKLENSGVTAGQYGSSSAIPIVTVDAQGLVTAASTTAIDSTTIANGTSNVAVANNGNITVTRAGSTKLEVQSNTVAITGDMTASQVNLSDKLVITSGTNCKIQLQDSNDNPDYEIHNADGAFRIKDTTNSATRVQVNSDGHIDLNGNVDVSSGLDVTGNITVSGTVDGVDVAALNTTVGNLGISGGTIASSTTATTQSASDNSTKVATTAFVGTAVSNLVDSSPGALNTLNELAAAINDDASFSTTVNNNIATKMPLSGGTFTGNVTTQKIVPANDSQFDIGENGTRFANVYADTYYGSGANLTGIEAFVSGMILLWSGAQNAIPSGFVLCNGSNSTPDLRDRFVVGAGNSYSVGATGGSNTATDNISISGSDTVSISGTDTVSISVSGNATGFTAKPSSGQGIHSMQSTSYNNNNESFQTSNYNYARSYFTIPFSGSGSDTVNISGTDTVTISGTDTVSIDTRSPYYALCYIMKT